MPNLHIQELETYEQGSLIVEACYIFRTTHLDLFNVASIYTTRNNTLLATLKEGHYPTL